MQDKIPTSLSERFAVMSLLCACMIVFFHATPAPEKGSLNWWVSQLFGREGVCSIAVPYFFGCSGFFLAGHYGEEGWWGKEVSKRVNSLVVPYYIWMAVGIVFGLLVGYVKTRFFHAESQDEFLSLPFLEKIVFYLGLHPFRDIGVLWYVRVLFFMVLAAPGIFFFLRWPVFTILVLGISHLVVTCLCYGVLSIDMYFLLDRFVSIRGLLYFFIGAALRVGRFELAKFGMPLWAGWIFGAVGLILLTLKNYLLLTSIGAVGAVLSAIAVPFLIVAIWLTLPSWNWVKELTGYSFPIFLMHNIFLSLVSMAFMVVGVRDSVVLQIPIALFRTMCAIGGAVLVAWFINRNIPRLSRIVFGGR